MFDQVKTRIVSMVQGHFWFVVATVIAVILLASYGLARAGHPESQWLWCGVAGLC